MDIRRIMKPVLIIVACIAAVFFMILLSGTKLQFSTDGADKGGKTADGEQIPVKVLILPKFEIGKMSGDAAGEAQHFYEELFRDADEYVIPGLGEDTVMYVKDGRAMCFAGVGKVDSALRTAAILTDDRFDYSDAYIISVGCGGSAKGNSVMGDVVIISGIVDYELGHHADPREMEDPDKPNWYPDETLERCAHLTPARELTDKVYELTKGIKLGSTDLTRKVMKETFDDAEWASREPKVIKGASVSADNFWKGEYDDRNAKLITEYYGCRDPYAVTEMEEIAVGQVVRRLGMMDRFISVRASVNMDVFLKGETPENLWEAGNSIINNDSKETLDIFPVAMENMYRVVSAIVKSIDNGEL